MKTENAEHVGMHVWERFGLGKAPFQYAGCEHKTFQAHPSAPKQPGSSCDYCGQGIAFVCWVQDATGHRFKVGSDCVERIGENGILRAYKGSPKRREIQRQMRHKREEAKLEKLMAQIESGEDKLKATPHSKGWKDKTAWDDYQWWRKHAGNAGKLKAFPRFAELAIS